MDKNVERLLKSYNKVGGINTIEGQVLPSRQSVALLLLYIKNLLFPGYFETSIQQDADSIRDYVTETMDQVTGLMRSEIYNSLCWGHCEKHRRFSQEELEKQSENITRLFLSTLPELRKELKKDIEATYNGDPAAISFSEVIMAYPGFHATMIYRIAHYFYEKGVPLIPRLMSELIHSETGIDIHPGAQIGAHFCIDHGTGLVIGETTEIGENVKIYQGVTLGALSITNRKTTGKRHPTVGNNVTIYARTTILGGDTEIGSDSIIGGNLWITKSIPEHSRVYISPDKHHVLTSKPKSKSKTDS